MPLFRPKQTLPDMADALCYNALDVLAAVRSGDNRLSINHPFWVCAAALSGHPGLQEMDEVELDGALLVLLRSNVIGEFGHALSRIGMAAFDATFTQAAANANLRLFRDPTRTVPLLRAYESLRAGFADHMNAAYLAQHEAFAEGNQHRLGCEFLATRLQASRATPATQLLLLLIGLNGLGALLVAHQARNVRLSVG